MSMHDDGRHAVDLGADLNEAIDATARALTERAPRPALRAGVARRIAARQGSSWRLIWSFGVATAAIVVAAVLLWPDEGVRPGSAGVEPDLPARSDPKTVERLAVSRDGVGPVPAGVRSDLPGRSDPMPAPAEPLVVESLEMMPLDLDVMDIPLLTVEALTIEPLSVQ
jgi:hypothetical protein